MKLYENVIIGRQDLTQQQMEALVVGLDLFVTKNGGEVVRSEYCGLRNLCYPIKKNNKGHYYVMQIKIESKHIRELERMMGLNEDIIRFLVVKVDSFETRENLITQAKFFSESNSALAKSKMKDSGYRNRNAINTSDSEIGDTDSSTELNVKQETEEA